MIIRNVNSVGPKAEFAADLPVSEEGMDHYSDLMDRFRDLSMHVDQLASRVSSLGGEKDDDQWGDADNPETMALEMARQGIKIRRQREKIFGIGLFSEPVWDILLELYVARAEDYEVTVGNACIAASVPMSSALRWCQMLQDRHIVQRYRDPVDRRRRFLKLTDCAYGKMTQLLAHFGRQL